MSTSWAIPALAVAVVAVIVGVWMERRRSRAPKDYDWSKGWPPMPMRWPPPPKPPPPRPEPISQQEVVVTLRSEREPGPDDLVWIEEVDREIRPEIAEAIKRAWEARYAESEKRPGVIILARGQTMRVIRGGARTEHWEQFNSKSMKEGVHMADDRAKGQQKLHTVRNPITGEERQVTQQEWRERGAQLRAEGFVRDDGGDEGEGEGTPSE